MRKFLIWHVLVAVLLAVVVYGGANAGYFVRPSFYTETLILLFLTTLVIFRYLSRTENPQAFLQLFLFTMLIKLIAFCGYALLMVLKDKAGAFANTVFFMVAYFIFTVVEIAFLYRRISQNRRP